jgi:hypothetical protein
MPAEIEGDGGRHTFGFCGIVGDDAEIGVAYDLALERRDVDRLRAQRHPSFHRGTSSD